MTTSLQETYESLQATLSDYRKADGHIVSIDAINDWAHQFKPPWVQLEPTDRAKLLSALDTTLKQSYWSEERIRRSLANAVSDENLVGHAPVDYWKRTTVLNIQTVGESQKDMLRLLDEALKSQLGISLHDCANDEKHCLYVDDAVFTGSRLSADLTAWAISSDGPRQCELTVFTLALHRYGEYSVGQSLPDDMTLHGVDLSGPIVFRTCEQLENRRRYRNASDVLWPTFIPAGTNGRFWPRNATGGSSSRYFPDAAGRALLEQCLFEAGQRIREIQRDGWNWRPLGWGQFEPGFGSMFITYRNCPNNAPLALWWGVQGWTPLLPRKPRPSDG